MRNRSTTVLADNQVEFFQVLKAKEEEYYNSLNFPAFGFISLDEEDREDNEYNRLSCNSNYHLEHFNKGHNKKYSFTNKKYRLVPCFRKKIFQHKKKGILSKC